MYTGNLQATSNKIKWAWTGTLATPAGAALNLVGATLSIGIRPPAQLNCLLTGTNADGHITITDGPNGVFAVSFAASEMRLLDAGEYEVGLVVVGADGSEYQVFALTLPVVDGIVP